MTISTATRSDLGKIFVPTLDSSEGLYVLSRGTATPWLNATVSAIKKLKELQPGWDSYGAKVLDLDSIHAAIELVRELASVVGIVRPQVAATPNGYVALLWNWRDSSRDLELSVLPQGEFQYCYSDESGESPDHCGVTKHPTEIAVILTKA